MPTPSPRVKKIKRPAGTKEEEVKPEPDLEADATGGPDPDTDTDGAGDAGDAIEAGMADDVGDVGGSDIVAGDAAEANTANMADMVAGDVEMTVGREVKSLSLDEIDWKGLLDVSMPLVVTDELLNILKPSRKLMELTAYTEQDLVGVPAAMLLDEDSREALFDKVRALTDPRDEGVKGSLAVSLKTTLVAQTGESLDAELSFFPLSLEGLACYLLLFDLTGDGSAPRERPSLDLGPLPLPMMMVDGEGKIAYLNPSAAEAMGFINPDEAVGLLFSDLVVEAADLRPFQRLLEARGEIIAYQLRLKTRQGVNFVTEVTAGALRNELGLPAGFLALFKDITGEVLRATEETSTAYRDRELVAGAPIGIALLDPDHRLRQVNPALAKLMGTNAEQLSRRRAEELVQPQQAKRLEAEIDRLIVLTESPTVTLEVEGRREDGATIPITLQLSPLPQAHGVMAIFQDATVHRSAIEQVKALEERYRELFENYDQTMVLADDDGYVVDANQVACEIFGLTKEEVIGRHIDEVLGEYGGSEDRAAIVPESQGTATGTPKLSDLDRQELEQLIREDKMAALGHLVAGVAHHINNPLAFIRANTNNIPEYLDSLEELLGTYDELTRAIEADDKAAGDPLLKKVLDRVREVRENVQPDRLLPHLRQQTRASLEGLGRIASVTEKLRAYARPGTGPTQAADVRESLRLTLELTRPHFAEGVTVNEILGPVAVTLCQPTLLNQVFQALLVNAAQAVGDSGKVDVRCRQTDEEIVVEVEDDGPGMAERLVRNIFNPLFTTRHEGIGLGLAIAYRIVQLHEGTLEVESEVGRGTTFILRLPIRPPDGRSPGQLTAGS